MVKVEGEEDDDDDDDDDGGGEDYLVFPPEFSLGAMERMWRNCSNLNALK
jgi:hypothetical protein